MRRDLLKVSEACGVAHPGLISVNDIDIVDGVQHKRPLGEVYGYQAGWGLPSEEICREITEIMKPRLPEEEKAPVE